MCATSTRQTSSSCDSNADPCSTDIGTATVSLTVTPVNDAPAANNDSATVAEGGTVTVLDSTAASVLANDTDAEGNTLTARSEERRAGKSGTRDGGRTVSYSHDGRQA